MYSLTFKITKFPFLFSDYDTRLSKSEHNRNEMNPAIEKAMNALKFVAQHVKNEDNFNSVSDHFKVYFDMNHRIKCIHVNQNRRMNHVTYD